MALMKSPLRYPGGKTLALKMLGAVLPDRFEEYREPLVGGGSLFIYIRQIYPHIPVWINDTNYGLYCFWKELQADAAALAQEVDRIRVAHQGRKLFTEFSQAEGGTDFEQAVRFFVLNRITFSGVVGSGGFSERTGRFTHSAIRRLAVMGPLMRGVRITNLDYQDLLDAEGSSVFVFCDPPYAGNEKSRLYGTGGVLHTRFDHVRFAKAMKQCRHTWLVTYGDKPEIRQRFEFAHLRTCDLRYGMTNYKQETSRMGRELLLSNYILPVGRQTSLEEL